MANKLDELNYDEPLMYELEEDGLDIAVIPKRIPAEKKPGDKLFLWCIRLSGILFAIPGIVMIMESYSSDEWGMGIVLIVFSLFPSLLLWFVMGADESYFDRLEQDINRAASEVDIFIDARVTSMMSLLPIVDKGLEHELKLALGTAKARSDGDADLRRVLISNSLTNIMTRVEAYPETKSNEYVLKLMREDVRHVSEITATRVLYNDKVAIWNRDIFGWPIKRIVAAKKGYTTRIPFIASRSVKEKNAESDFFK